MRNNNHSSHSATSGEKRVTCRHCSEKFTIKLGIKNQGYAKQVTCRKCGTTNFIRVSNRRRALSPERLPSPATALL